MIKMVVEDSGSLDIRSDHNLIWVEVVWGRTEVEVNRGDVMESGWQANLGALSGSSRGSGHRVGGGGESD